MIRRLFILLLLVSNTLNSVAQANRIIKPKPGYDLSEFIAKNIQYPQMAKDANVEGSVVLEFMVDENGKISHVRIVRPLGYACDEEAVRVVKKMPDWKPGSYNGKPSRMFFVQRIRFDIRQ